MPALRVLDVGNCDPDHRAIREMLERHFGVAVDRVMFVREALEAIGRAHYDLVLVNRLIFADGSPGIDLVQNLRDAGAAAPPVMLISNLPEAQQAAQAAGAVAGFGKAAIGAPETLRLLGRYLGAQAPSARRGD